MAGIDPFGSVRSDALSPGIIRRAVRRFLAEDVGAGDVTTRSVVPHGLRGKGALVARESCVLAGLDVALAVFQMLDEDLHLEPKVRDGDRVAAAGVVAMISGRTAPMLTGERVALNLLQHLSAIATLTRRYVDAVAGTGVSISDTRKTTPGLRLFDKRAVRAGGGRNHRVGLFDAVLIKDNHVAAAGGVRQALDAVRRARVSAPVQIEVDSLDQLSEALDVGIDAVLLDNMPPDTVAVAVDLIRRHETGGRCWIEASGGITLVNVRLYAETGVDTISIGALTHSAPSVDLALDLARS